jgi:hypothetical protein
MPYGSSLINEPFSQRSSLVAGSITAYERCSFNKSNKISTFGTFSSYYRPRKCFGEDGSYAGFSTVWTDMVMQFSSPEQHFLPSDMTVVMG